MTGPAVVESPRLAAGSHEVQYLTGIECTWHGPEDQAKHYTDRMGCPFCGGVVMLVGSEASFWNGAAIADRANPGYEELMRWSQGKCYPDFDTALNAYRQAMEE